MTDRPIIFSGPMIQALLEDRKTQTRRLIRDQPGDLDKVQAWDDGSWRQNASDGSHMLPLNVRWRVGDRLWVREAHMLAGGGDPGLLIYREGWREQAEREGFENIPTAEPKGWRSPIHMPRWASRLTLTVTDVRVQHLQAISEADAVDEGLIKLPRSGRYVVVRGEQYFGAARHTAKARYADLWNSLHSRNAWPEDPWVVALTFTVAQANIDTLAEAA